MTPDPILIELVYEEGTDGRPRLKQAGAVDPKHVVWASDGRVLVRDSTDHFVEAPMSGPHPKFVRMPREEVPGLRSALAGRLKDYYTLDPDVHAGMQDYLAGRESFEQAAERTIRALVKSKMGYGASCLRLMDYASQSAAKVAP